MNTTGQVGRVPCLLHFPNGRYTGAPDATAQPIVLPLNDAKSPRGRLDDLIMERTWPGSL